jgi:hypothetical protein
VFTLIFPAVFVAVAATLFVMAIGTQFLQILWHVVAVITIYMIHVCDDSVSFFFNQSPVGIAAKPQIDSAIMIGTHVLSDVFYTRSGFGSELSNLDAVRTKMLPAIASSIAYWITTAWIYTAGLRTQSAF